MNPIIEKIERELNDLIKTKTDNVIIHGFNQLTRGKIKAFYRTAILSELEALAKEAIGEEKDVSWSAEYNAENWDKRKGWNSHRQEVIEAFKKRGIN